jgi:hypothetical protein
MEYEGAYGDAADVYGANHGGYAFKAETDGHAADNQYNYEENDEGGQDGQPNLFPRFYVHCHSLQLLWMAINAVYYNGGGGAAGGSFSAQRGGFAGGIKAAARHAIVFARQLKVAPFCSEAKRSIRHYSGA